MRWEKLGRIFNPNDYEVNGMQLEFAQSPQVLAFENFIRIYFSTRIKDNSGKYLSKIAYVDFTSDFSKVLKVSQHEIITLGKLGCYDEHGIFPLNIVKNNQKIIGFIGGWTRRISVMIDGAIGIAESIDLGETFQRIGDGPIMGPNLQEPFLIADPFVNRFNDDYHMWYIFGDKWVFCKKLNQPERIYKIGHATSKNMLDWNREGQFIIPEVFKDEECQALPTVVQINDTYHMYFCFRYATDFRNKERGYRLGHAYSHNLKDWTRDDESCNLNKSKKPEDWDSEMICYPHAFLHLGKTYLLYNGNEFGKFGFGLAELVK
jgi:predicted GH43/DUF377 family glycosyl hydrolase